ncbi:MAG: hypothetical protein KKC77_09895 [Proteobacteria bacterium]|nr:hypothetical protein [Pseudomonadota bacterium]
MDAMMENNIRQEQIESFGRLMAGFSHDMKNHLGIIRESNGLMGDILEMGGLGEDEISLQRLKKSISAIERRVVITANMFHHLSGFAHRADAPYSSFQLNDLISEECIFLERFSRLKQIEIVQELGDGLLAIYNDPALLQHVLYRLYIQCLEQIESGHSLIIITSQEGENIVITFRLPAAPQVDLENWFGDTLLAAIEKLNGTLEQSENTQDHTDVRLIIASLPIEE